MKSLKKVLIYGLLIWAVPFVVAMLIFPIHQSNRPLFESIMPVVLTVAVMLFVNMYFKEVKKDFVSEGIKLGVVWLVISLVIDLMMFSSGPMKMTLADYMADIGITYLMIPVLTVGSGLLLEKKS